MTNSEKTKRAIFDKDHVLKIGIVGAGKRVKNFILPLLRKNEKFQVTGFFSRSEETRSKFSKEESIKPFDSIESLGEECDAFIVCVNANASTAVNQQVSKVGKPFLVETPCSDPNTIKYCIDNDIIAGALEQWPFLPLEQFKKLYIERFFKTPVYLAVNDCRSLDYHGMAQIRSYAGLEQKPSYAKGHGLGLSPTDLKYQNNSGDVVPFQDNWDFGSVQMEKSVLLHHFSYTCKVAPFRSLQTLRAYSADGTIVTGKLKSFGTDYDILEFGHLSGEKTVNSVVRPEIKTFDDKEVTISIVDEVTGLAWKNPYADLELDDQKTAVMTILDGFRDKIVSGDSDHFYSAENSLIDLWITATIKQSAQEHKPIKMGSLW